MGGNNSKKKSPQKSEQSFCIDDLSCQNIDSNRSVAGGDIVLVCPSAKCAGGTCICGPGCVRDPYTGMCCSSIEVTEANNYKTSFCKEDVYDANRTPKPFIPESIATLAPII